MSRFHNHPENGPQPCGADPSNPNARGCPFGSETDHYESKAEARAAFEKILEEAHGSSAILVTDPAVEALKHKLCNMPLNPSVEELQALGEAFNNIVTERLGFDTASLEKLTADNWGAESAKYKRVGEENARLLSELVPTGGLNNKLAGNMEHRRVLKGVTELLPRGALERVTGTINLRVEGRGTKWGGTYSQGAIVSSPVPVKRDVFSHPGAKVGDYLYESTVFKGEEERLLGTSLEKVVRMVGDPLVDGESAKDYVDRYGGDDKFIEVLKSGLVDSDFRIKEGKAAEFEESFPELAEQMKGFALTETYWAGEKPKQRARSAYTYIKEKEGITEFRDSMGKMIPFDKPLYRAYEKGIDRTQHTITAEKGSSNSILLHEFTHAVQGSGAPTGEKEMFKKLTEGKSSQKAPAQHFSYYPGGPDPYMLDEGGREVLTRATEGFFYPRENPYLYGSEASKNNGKEVRDWVAGAWLNLGR